MLIGSRVHGRQAVVAPSKLKMTFAQRVPMKATPRAKISDKVLAEYIKTAQAIAEEPWSMLKVVEDKARQDVKAHRT